MSDDVVLTGPQVARLLKVSLRTIERLAASGSLPSFRVGRLRRYGRRGILAWAESRGVRCPKCGRTMAGTAAR